MNITLSKIDEVNAVVKLEVTKNDYEAEVEKALKETRRKVNLPGFRKGMVPLGMVKKMFGKSILAEQVNKLIADKLYNYIRDNKLDILGEPLPNKDQEKIDFEKDENFDLSFDLALAPEVTVAFSKEDKLPYYEIKVDEETVNRQIKNYTSNYGTYEEAESIEGKDIAKGSLTELGENGEAKENGIKIENAVIMPSFIKDEEEKAKFEGQKKDSTIVFNPCKAYKGEEAELSSLLKIKKEEVKDITGDFSFEIKDITRYKEAELDTVLFDKIFGEGKVKTEEEFRDKIKTLIEGQNISDSDYKFLIDARKFLEEKAGEIKIPDDFIKRWLLDSQRVKEENLEKDYPNIKKDLKFQLIREKIVRDNEIKAEEKDLTEIAKAVTKAQFAQYGMPSVPEDVLENYSKEMLKKEDTVKDLLNKVIENKLTDLLKKQVTLEKKEVSPEEFKKLFEEEKLNN